MMKHCDEDTEEHNRTCHLLKISLEDHRQERMFGRKITGLAFDFKRNSNKDADSKSQLYSFMHKFVSQTPNGIKRFLF